MSESRLKLLTALMAMLLIIIISTTGLVYFEGWSIYDSLWVTVVSLTTTGYGDIVPVTIGGRLFLLVILVIGVGVVAYSLGAIISILVEAQISKVLGNNRMIKSIDKLENHVIVCGAGRVGSNVANILKNEKIPFVLIDIEEHLVGSMREEGYLAMQGDATHDSVLMDAGIERARGIIAALADDAYNVFVVLTARAVKPDLKIVARAAHPESVAKLQRAGADKVIAPTQIGGRQMAMAMIKPASVDLVESLFTSHNLEIQLEEVLITDQSPLADKLVCDAFDRKISNIIAVAIIRGDRVIMNPQGAEKILIEDIIVLLGSRSDLEKMEKKGF